MESPIRLVSRKNETVVLQNKNPHDYIISFSISLVLKQPFLYIDVLANIYNPDLVNNSQNEANHSTARFFPLNCCITLDV